MPYVDGVWLPRPPAAGARLDRIDEGDMMSANLGDLPRLRQDDDGMDVVEVWLLGGPADGRMMPVEVPRGRGTA